MNSAAILNFNDVLTPLYSAFTLHDLTDIANPEKRPDCLLLWTDFAPDMRMIATASLQNKVPVFMVQHGRRAMRDYWTNIAEPTALCAFVWGERDRKDAIKGGWHPDQVFRVGAPWFSFRPERKEEKGLVLFDVPHWNVDIPAAQTVWEKLKTIDSIRPIAKLIQPSMQRREHYPGEQCLTYRGEPGHMEATYDLIARASVVVTMLDGTLELMAHSLGVPVIHVTGFESDYPKLEGTWNGVEDVLPAKGSIPSSIQELPTTIHDVMENPGMMAKDARKKLLAEAGDPDKDTPVRNIAVIVGELVKRYQSEAHTPVNIFDRDIRNGIQNFYEGTKTIDPTPTPRVQK